MIDPRLQLAAYSNNQGAFVDARALVCDDSKVLTSVNPATQEVIGKVALAAENQYQQVVAELEVGFERLRVIPAPKRGDIVRTLGESLREYKVPLGELVALEMGKIRAEGIGEVQEMIDICDFAVGLSRQLYGNTMHSERPGHRMYEQYHPLGPIGVITAFNFPVAVWAWNAAIAIVCGNPVLWKPSSSTPLTAIAVQQLAGQAATAHGVPGIFGLVVGSGRGIGESILNDKRLPLISFTGSTQVGRHVSETVAKRFGNTILELGGNNAVIVTPNADLDMAVRSVLFGAVGTAGQRCTSTRRVIIHREVVKEFIERLTSAYAQVTIGDPLDPDTLMGPLINEDAVKDGIAACIRAGQEGGVVLYGGSTLPDKGPCFMEPTIIKMPSMTDIVREETFAPILYIIEYHGSINEAIEIHNDVPQGLSSAIFTNDVREAEQFLSHVGSDCGIANVNIGTSGAEIGGAFGGEKETGGGREAGSDAWKQYMRRQTNTINWSRELPLAQGIEFGG